MVEQYTAMEIFEKEGNDSEYETVQEDHTE